MKTILLVCSEMCSLVLIGTHSDWTAARGLIILSSSPVISLALNRPIVI